MTTRILGIVAAVVCTVSGTAEATIRRGLTAGGDGIDTYRDGARKRNLAERNAV